MGQQRYEAEIQSAIGAVAHADEWRFHPVVLRSLRSDLVGNRRYPAIVVRSAPLWVARCAGEVFYRGSDLVHRFDLRLPPAHCAEVLTVHDLAPLRFSDEGSVPRSAAAGVRRARGVIAPSAFAAQEISDLFGVASTTVIYNGVTPAAFDAAPLEASELERLGLGPAYIVHAGGATARKNLGALAEAWRELAPRFPELTIALCGPADERRTRLFEGLPRVRLLGRLEPASLVARLMAGASAVVVPSLYEGFGFPALEGMACGVPVVAARAGALPEVCGDAAELVSPDAEGLAAGLERVLTQPPLSDRLRKEGPLRAASFSWARAAREHLALYERVLAD